MITLIKLLTWLASPIGLLAALGFTVGILRIRNKAPRSRLMLTTLAVGQLLFFAWPPVAVRLSEGLEAKAQALETRNQGKPYAAILLLGGGISPAVPGIQPANIHEAFDRVVYAAQLYQQGAAPRIMVSGGSSLRDNYPDAQSEADAMKEHLILMGVPEQAILLEDQSLTTRQNMALTARLMQTHQITGRLALVTSATHMPRAAATAERAGLSTDAYPTDRVAPLVTRPFAQHWLPNAQALEESERALKEWLALLVAY